VLTSAGIAGSPRDPPCPPSHLSGSSPPITLVRHGVRPLPHLPREFQQSRGSQRSGSALWPRTQAGSLRQWRKWRCGKVHSAFECHFRTGPSTVSDIIILPIDRYRGLVSRNGLETGHIPCREWAGLPSRRGVPTQGGEVENGSRSCRSRRSSRWAGVCTERPRGVPGRRGGVELKSAGNGGNGGNGGKRPSKARPGHQMRRGGPRQGAAMEGSSPIGAYRGPLHDENVEQHRSSIRSGWQIAPMAIPDREGTGPD
jgi:hypothetical protein